jgi:hypothetical protein
MAGEMIMNKVQQITNPIRVAQTKQPTQNHHNCFSETLKQASQSSAADPSKASHAAPLGEIQSVTPHHVGCSTQQIIKDTGRLLELLDRFSQDIGNPFKTLKEIEPTLKDLNAHADMLASASNEAASQDEDLKAIADRCHLRAKIEYLKFKRGDYI